MIKPGTEMYSIDWLQQCFEEHKFNKKLSEGEKKAILKIAYDYQVGTTWDAINIANTVISVYDGGYQHGLEDGYKDGWNEAHSVNGVV